MSTDKKRPNFLAVRSDSPATSLVSHTAVVDGLWACAEERCPVTWWIVLVIRIFSVNCVNRFTKPLGSLLQAWADSNELTDSLNRVCFLWACPIRNEPRTDGSTDSSSALSSNCFLKNPSIYIYYIFRHMLEVSWHVCFVHIVFCWSFEIYGINI